MCGPVGAWFLLGTLVLLCTGRPQVSLPRATNSTGHTNSTGLTETPTPEPLNCSSGEFPCVAEMICIPRSFVCDRDNDCSDSSDEAGCRNVSCSADQFQCSNGKCVSKDWLCDDDDDCADNSDEKNCSTPVLTCLPHEFRCVQDDACIHRDWVCDDDRDCLDGSDETNCHNLTIPTTAPAAGRCEKLMIRMCAGIGYNITRVPNFFGDTTQDNAHFKLQSFMTVMKKYCAVDVVTFLCTIFAPPCSASQAPVLPCRSVCERARKGCEAPFNKLGLTWPDDLNCSLFQVEDNENCFSVPVATTTKTPEMKPSTAQAASPTGSVLPLTTGGNLTCHEDEFQCSNRRCLPQNWRCDGEDDCGDNSDELTCTKCEPVSLAVCRGFQYNTTRFPNLLGHKTQQEAGSEFQRMYPNMKCSPFLDRLLCSVYVPPCTAHAGVLLPCRTLCERAKTRCEASFNQSGFNWPEFLNCEQFPDGSQESCFNGTAEGLVTTPSSRTTPSTHPTAAKCEEVDIPLCRETGYNFTFFPNHLGHKTQDEAVWDMMPYFPILKSVCSPLLRPFVCSLHIPPCSVTRRMLKPCRSLCERVKSTCEPYWGKLLFTWPNTLQCDKLPDEKNEVCFSGPSIPSVTVPTTKATSVSCERVSTPMCRGLLYNSTQFPNSLGHQTQEQASLEVQQYFPLVKIQCSPFLSPFLCSLYVPPCTRSPRPLRPCRSLCERAMFGCMNIMKQFSLGWPNHLKCDNFPEEGREPCFKGPTFPTTRPPLPGKCEGVIIPLCRSLNYSLTLVPNMFGHRSQQAAGLEVQQFFPLVKSSCSPYLRSFLCAAYSPRCTGAFKPCRALCAVVVNSCQELLTKFGFALPEAFNCSMYPDEKEEICYQGNISHSTTSTPVTTVQASLSPTPSVTLRPITQPTKACGGILASSRGRLQSPEFPENYPSNLFCRWIITLPKMYHVISFSLRHVQLEEDQNCLYDYILILDKLYNQVGPRYCGSYMYPMMLDVKGNVAVVLFRSDSSTTKQGFLITYRGHWN